LLKRVQRDGALPPVNAIVDLYNAVSLRYALPVGGEDAATYVGAPRLIRAVGTERFDTTQNGVAQTETPEPGEVVWCDDLGVTCRRWNWRQGTRTRIETSTTRAWFILEALGPMPEADLLRAGEELANGLRSFSPNAAISSRLIS
jgi:DNA/RNA-binding domain of Phe-tRNA-synthetase-like protein